MLIPRQIGITLRTSLLTFSRSVERVHYNVTSSLYWLKVQLGFKHVCTLDTIKHDTSSLILLSVFVHDYICWRTLSLNSLTACDFISSPHLTSVEGYDCGSGEARRKKSFSTRSASSSAPAPSPVLQRTTDQSRAGEGGRLSERLLLSARARHEEKI